MTDAAVSEKPSLWIRCVATGFLAFYIAGVGAATGLGVVSGHGPLQSVVFPFTAFALVGWAITYRRPRVAVGWVCTGIGFLTALGSVSQTYVWLVVAEHASPHGFTVFAAWVQMWFWYPLIVLSTGFTILLFPDGLPSRRWRPVAATLTLALTVVTVMAALSPTLRFGRRHLPNPIGISGVAPNVEKTTLFSVASVVMVGCLAAAVVSLIMRFRRSRGVERAQIKWFAFGASALVLIFGVSVLLPNFNNSIWNNVLFPVALTCVPVACGIAILRYRLYDIDRVVSRSVAYLLVTGFVVGLYIGAVALTENVLSFSSSVAVAASTLIAAAAFQPVRRRVQSVVDRRFNRARYDAARTVEGFAVRLRDEIDPYTVRTDLLTVTADVLQPSALTLWVRA